MIFFEFDSFFWWAPRNQKLCWEHGKESLSRTFIWKFLEYFFDNLHRSDTVGTMKLQTTASLEKTFTLEVLLESRNDYVEVEITVGFEWQNDGIGPYEYWGSKGYDKGIDYLEVTQTIWDSAGFTPEEVKEIEKEMFASMKRWIEQAEEYFKNEHFD